MNHIAFFIPDLHGGGAQRMIINMANEFARRGFSVDLVMLRGAGPYSSLIKAPVRLIDLKQARAVTALPAVIRYLRTETPDILFSALTVANLLALLAKKISPSIKTRIFVSERNFFSLNILQQRVRGARTLRFLMRWLYPTAEKVICISQGVSADIANVTGIPPDKIVTIYNPVITDEHENVKPAALPPGDPVIVTSGRLVPQKDHETLLNAFSLLQKTTPSRLFIMGDGPLKQVLQALARHLEIEDRVTFMGFVKDPLPVMAAADLFVISSRWEGFCNVLVEALSFGIPTVSTDCPSGPAEILADGTYGALVPVGDARALARAIEEALLQKGNAHERKKRAHDFHVKSICDNYQALFNGGRA